jgi:hypothetical protein
VSKCGSILNNENEMITCSICNNFHASNNKALSAHQRACKKRNSLNPAQINVKTEKSDNSN